MARQTEGRLLCWPKLLLAGTALSLVYNCDALQVLQKQRQGVGEALHQLQ